MGGETKSTIVYGFPTKYYYNNNNNSLGALADPGTAVYYNHNLNLKTTNIEKALIKINEYKISKEDEINKFNDFAKKYNKTPTWMAIITGEMELNICEYDPDEDEDEDEY